MDMGKPRRIAGTAAAAIVIGMISAPCWSGAHPLLAAIPLDCPCTLPCSLIYAKSPPQEVMRFILAVGQVNKTE